MLYSAQLKYSMALYRNSAVLFITLIGTLAMPLCSGMFDK